MKKVVVEGVGTRSTLSNQGNPTYILHMSENHHTAADAKEALRVFKVERYEIRALRRVRVGAKHVIVIDINGDALRIDGIGAEDPEITDFLKMAGASYDPTTVHDTLPNDDLREYEVVRADPWGHDRVL